MTDAEIREGAEEAANRERLWSLVKDMKFGMLTTSEEDGSLSSRPMTTQDAGYDGSIWFFAPDDGPLAHAIARNPRVNVSYAHPGDMRFVSVCGVAELVDDPARKRALWNPMAEAWFQGGPEHSHAALLRVEVRHAEYWEGSSSRMVQLFAVAKAAITGRPPVDLGEHVEVKL